MLRFLVKLANGKEMAFDVDDSDVYLGRVSTINDICLNDPSISRQHAHVKIREEGYTIYDLKSLNGVVLNDARVSRALLKNGDRLRLGDVEIEVEIGDLSSSEVLQAIETSEQTQPTLQVEQEETEVTRPPSEPVEENEP